MSRRASLVSLALGLAVGVAFGLASPVAATRPGPTPPSSFVVQVDSPVRGVALEAGSEALLSWHFEGVIPPAIEEWEAFLSFDGGASYPVRITPHLDSSLQRVRWRVPAVPVREARLLLRFGDEREEREIDPGIAFEIRGSPAALAAFEAERFAARQVFAPGEAARAGMPGVVEWVEGSRHGARLARVHLALVGTSFVAGPRLDAASFAPCDGETPDLDPLTTPPPIESRPTGGDDRTACACGGPGLPLAHSDLLPRLQRWNV